MSNSEYSRGLVQKTEKVRKTLSSHLMAASSDGSTHDASRIRTDTARIQAEREKTAPHDEEMPVVVVAGSEEWSGTGKKYTVYRLIVQESGVRREIFRRYREFRALHESLAAVQRPAALATVQLPALPPRRLFKNMDPDFVRQRGEALQRYLQDLLAIPEARHNERMRRFLEEL